MTVTLGHAGKPQPVIWMSVEDYLRFEETSEVRHEYLDGFLFALPPTSKKHNRLVVRLVTLLAPAAEQGGCRLYTENVKLRVTPTLFYYPDVMVTCREEEAETHVVDAPCLIIEVLSESAVDKDRREKWLAYKQIAALEAYVLVYQEERRLEVFARQGEAWGLFDVRERAISLGCPPVTLELGDIYQGIL
jgi:Uma2 family endonuclease